MSQTLTLDPLGRQRLAAESKLQTVLLRYFKRQRRILQGRLQHYITLASQSTKEVQLSNMIAQLLYNDTTSKVTQTALANVLQTALVRSLEVVGRTTSDALTDRQFDATSRKVVAKYDPAQFVTDLDRSTANQLSLAFKTWAETNGSQQDLIDQIAGILPGGPQTPASNRASRVATTETSRIYGLTRNEVYRLKGYKTVAWRTDPSEKTCAICAALGDQNQGSGATAPVSDPVFVLHGIAYTVPAHPFCRCHLEPVGPRDDAWARTAESALDLEQPLGRAVNAGVAFGITATTAFVTQHLPQLVSYIQPEIRRMFEESLYSRDFKVVVEDKDIFEQVQDLLDALDATIGYEKRNTRRVVISDTFAPGVLTYSGPSSALNIARVVANDLDRRLLTESPGLPGSMSSFRPEWVLLRERIRQSAAFNVYAERDPISAADPNWSELFENAFKQYLRRNISDPNLDKAIGSSFWSYGDFQGIAAALDQLLRTYGLSPEVMQGKLQDPYGAAYRRPTSRYAFALPLALRGRSAGRSRGIVPVRN